MADLLSVQAILNAVFDRTTNKLKITATGTAPSSSQYVVLSADATLTAERVLTGTANQIVLTDNGAGSTVVLSLPQDIATSSALQFARLGLGVAADTVNLLTITQPVATSGSPSIAVINGGAHTTLAAGVEATDINFNLARTVQFATGAIATQRAVRIQGVTYAFVGASTITAAITLDVDAPIAGTNATLTSAFAIRASGRLAINSTTANQITLQGGSGNQSTIVVVASNTQLVLSGNRSAASTLTDIQLDGQNTRTAGFLTTIANNGTTRMTANYYGGITLTQGAGATGTLQSFLSTRANHSNQTLSTEVSDLSLTAYTRQWATGAIATQREILFDQATYAAVGASTITTAMGMDLATPTVGANVTITNLYGLNLGGTASSLGATAAGTTYRAFRIAAHTITVTGSTQVTSAVGFAGAVINQITITDASAVTIDAAASLYIAGPPIAAGSVTLTNTYSLWIDAGSARFDGNMGFFATAPAVQQTSGENLTNNVTSGGTDGTIANFTDLTLYANDSAAIRNDLYQLARKLKQINDGLRTYGLFT